MRQLKLLLAATILTGGTQAHAQDARTVLPIPPVPFTGTVAENVLDAKGPATVTLSMDGQHLGRVQLPGGMLMAAGNGETLDIGRDLGVTVTNYRTPHGAIEGDVPHVSIVFD